MLNQDLLLVGLYTYLPPNRNELKKLLYTFSLNKSGDFVQIKNDKTVVLQLNSIVKKHKKIILEIPEILQDLLKESLNL